MADTLSKAERSKRMSRIRGSGNRSTELRLMALFKAHGIRGWRRGYPAIGKPDFVFPEPKVAVFVDGCFWHGCPIHCRMPKSRVAFWRSKLAANTARDSRVTRALRRLGWRVLRVWEHDLTQKRQHRAVRRLVLSLEKPRLTSG